MTKRNKDYSNVTVLGEKKIIIVNYLAEYLQVSVDLVG